MREQNGKRRHGNEWLVRQAEIRGKCLKQSLSLNYSGMHMVEACQEALGFT